MISIRGAAWFGPVAPDLGAVRTVDANHPQACAGSPAPRRSILEREPCTILDGRARLSRIRAEPIGMN